MALTFVGAFSCAYLAIGLGVFVGAMPIERVSMSDTTVGVTDAADKAAEAATSTTSADKSDAAPLGEAGIKALQAERDARKVAEDAQKALEKRIQEFEDRDKTEAQKAADQAARLAADLEAANRAREAAELNATRLSVAHAKGLPAELVARLQGTTQAELEADADSLLAIVGTKADTEAPRKPAPVRTLGTGGEGHLTKDEQFAAFMESAF